jgi:hypothetical protein
VEKPALEFFDPHDVPSESIEGVDGLSEQILARNDITGDYTRLLHFEPGTDTTPMGLQIHEFWEEVWIIEGAIHDLTLGRTFTAGMYACRPPGMPHGPWQSPEGCKTFEVRHYECKR